MYLVLVLQWYDTRVIERGRHYSSSEEAPLGDDSCCAHHVKACIVMGGCPLCNPSFAHPSFQRMELEEVVQIKKLHQYGVDGEKTEKRYCGCHIGAANMLSPPADSWCFCMFFEALSSVGAAAMIVPMVPSCARFAYLP